MAESTALPPTLRISFPISEHFGFSLATAALKYSPELLLTTSSGLLSFLSIDK